ncbi:MAG: hypothetical protein ACTSPB_22985, partial [Candidatus Thorarchaeota archaeon]
EDDHHDTICIYALRFQQWIDQLMKVLDEPDVVIINQAKILLLDKFFEWRRWVPLEHRQRMGIHGHTCVFQVFECAYEKLRFVEMNLTPPMLFIPQAITPRENPPNIAGLFLGEGLDADDE